jgi:hypothetical protein
MPTPTHPDAAVVPATFELVPADIYRDIHKAVRANLFEVVLLAGRTDPSDRTQRITLAAAVADLADFLTFHAEHEDGVLEPMIAEVLPDEAAAIGASHVEFEAAMSRIRALAAVVFDEARTDARASLHELYLSLADFTAIYLEHQRVEERVVMPALVAHFGVDACVEANMRIVAAIAPDALAWGLAKALPVMNADERFEMVAGIRATAPADAFAGVVAFTGEVLDPEDHAQLVARLDATALVEAGA